MKIETINPNGTPGVNIPPPKPKTSLHKDPYDPNQQPAKRGEESLPPFAQGGPRDQHPETNSNMQPTGTNTHHPTRGPRMQGDAQVWYRPPRIRKKTPKKDRTPATRPDQLQPGRVRQKTPGTPRSPEKSYTHNTNLGDLATWQP